MIDISYFCGHPCTTFFLPPCVQILECENMKLIEMFPQVGNKENFWDLKFTYLWCKDNVL